MCVFVGDSERRGPKMHHYWCADSCQWR